MRRLLLLLAALTLLLAACGGDDGGGEDTGSASGAGETEAETMAESTEGDTEGGGMPSFDDGTTMAELQEAGTVVVGTKYDQPLFGVQTPEGVEGFDAEIAKLMVEGIFGDGDPVSHIEWREAVSANREDFIENGEVDMIVATYTINDERDQRIDYAGQYYQAGQDIMVPAGNPMGIGGIEDLNSPDVNVCSAQGSTSIQNIEEMAPEAETTTFDSYSRCAEALADGRVDAVSTDNVILVGLISEYGSDVMELVDNPFTEEPYGIGIQEGDSDFQSFLNERLQEIYESGEWAEAFESTVGQVVETTPEPPPLTTGAFASTPSESES